LIMDAVESRELYELAEPSQPSPAASSP